MSEILGHPGESSCHMERRDAEGFSIRVLPFYARAVKQKVWNEAENGERDWGETLKTSPHTPYGRLRLARFAPHFTDIFTDFEKNPTVLQSIEQAIDPFCRFSFLCYCAIFKPSRLVPFSLTSSSIGEWTNGDTQRSSGIFELSHFIEGFGMLIFHGLMVCSLGTLLLPSMETFS